MTDNNFNIFDKAADNLRDDDVFAKHPHDTLDAQDIFKADPALLESLTRDSKSTGNSQYPQTDIKASLCFDKKTISVLTGLVLANVFIIIFFHLYFKENESDSAQQPYQPIYIQQNTQNYPAESMQDAVYDHAEQNSNALKPSVETKDFSSTEHKPVVSGYTISNLLPSELLIDMMGPVSFKTAQEFYNQNYYKEAINCYHILYSQIDSRTAAGLMLKDYLMLHIALCLDKLGYQDRTSWAFEKVLTSSSPAIQLLANYNLMFMDMRNANYLKARERAYQTLCLADLFTEQFSESLESCCYFVIGEAITNHLRSIENNKTPLPGNMWSADMQIETIPAMSQSNLLNFLKIGQNKLAKAALDADLKKLEIEQNDLFELAANNNSLAEVMEIICSASNMNLSWSHSSKHPQMRPVTAYMNNSSQARLCEYLAGSSGYIADITGDNISIVDLEQYQNLNAKKNLLLDEGIAIWRKYLIKYRGDHRTPNAHYALGLLHEINDDDPTAIAEFKLIASRYPHHDIAPYALFESSQTKAHLGDFMNARADLNELTTFYPNCSIIDQATLHMAQSAFETAHFEEAQLLFKKVNALNTTKDIKATAALGAGKSLFRMNKYDEAKDWLSTGISMSEDKTDTKVLNALHDLGNSFIEINEPAKAAQTLALALNKSLPDELFSLVAIDKAKADSLNGDHVRAINTINMIKAENLNPEITCKMILAKSQILSELGLFDIAVNILKDKKNYIARIPLKAAVMMELAKCYYNQQEYEKAQIELMEAIRLLKPGEQMETAYLSLAQASLELEDYKIALDSAKKVLSYSQDANISNTARLIAARAYESLGQTDLAAKTLVTENFK